MATLPMIDFAVKGNLYTFLQKDDTIANAEQLIATVGVTDKVPYQFRTSGGSADIGNREEDTIVGLSMAWNQLLPDTAYTATGGTASTVDGVCTFTASAPGQQAYKAGYFESGHVICAMIYWKTTSPTSDVKARIFARDVNGVASTSWQSAYAIFMPKSTGLVSIGVVDRRTSGFDAIQIRNAMAFDLTLLFGSTIADYIYSIEQATPGAGVEWCKRFSPRMFAQYNPYDAGKILSVEGLQSHDMTGLNQYDPEAGTAKLLGGMLYQITGTYTALSYTDIAGNAETITPDANGKFTPANNGVLTVTGGNATDTCVHLVWSGTHDGEHEPYILHSYPLDSSLVLRGILKLDENNKVYADGDVYKPDGTVERRYGIIDLGTLNWTYRGEVTTGLFSIVSFSDYKHSNSVLAICDKYAFAGTATSVSGAGKKNDKTISLYVNSDYPDNSGLYIKDTAYTDAATFKAAMSGVYLVYELATPTTESATPYTTPQIVNDWGTEEYVTDSIVPVGHTTTYGANLRDKLQHLPDLADGDGNYLVQQTGTQMVLVPFRIPQATGADGTYVLKATVSGGTPTYTWVLEE